MSLPQEPWQPWKGEVESSEITGSTGQSVDVSFQTRADGLEAEIA